MPLYEFECSQCEEVKTIVRTISRRNEGEPCACGGRFEKVEIASGQVIDVKGGWSMGAVMNDGSIVKGQFGKTAKNKGPRYNK